MVRAMIADSSFHMLYVGYFIYISVRKCLGKKKKKDAWRPLTISGMSSYDTAKINPSHATCITEKRL